MLYECPDGTLAVAPSTHIIEQLSCIFKMSSDLSEYPVGILTAEHRDIWAKSRVKLLQGKWKILNRISCMPNRKGSTSICQFKMAPCNCLAIISKHSYLLLMTIIIV